MLLNQQGRVFVGMRIDTPGAWQMPQGGVEPGEDLLAAARRELQEEIGTDNVIMVAESAQWYSYDVPAPIAHQLWQGKYQGQKQKWFLMRFQGNEQEININTLHPEFKEWRWAPVEELEDLVVDFKRELYRGIVTEFSPLIHQHHKVL